MQGFSQVNGKCSAEGRGFMAEHLQVSGVVVLVVAMVAIVGREVFMVAITGGGGDDVLSAAALCSY